MAEMEGKNMKNEASSVAMDSISVETFYSFEALKPIQRKWDEFIESIGGGLFLTYDWCRIWWKYYGKKRQLMIFVFRYNGDFCAILPMFLEKVRIGPVGVRVVKIVGADFTTTTTSIPIKEDFISKVIQIFFNELRSKYRWDILHIGSICGKYDSFGELMESFQAINSSYRIQAKNSGVQIYFRVARSLDEQIASLSRENRRGMRRSYGKIIKQGIPLTCVHASNENFDHVFDNFVQLHQSHWKKIGKPGHFEAWPASYKFHREVALIQLNYQRLRLYEINLDGRCIGYHYAYKFGDTYHYFLFARKRFEKSEKIDFFRIDFGEMVRQALQEDVKWFDTTRGKYDYQLKLGGQLYPTRDIYIQSNKFPAGIQICIFRSLAWILNIAYSKLWRQRIAPRIGLRLGQFWVLWLKTHTLSY